MKFRLGMNIKSYYETRLRNVKGLRHVTKEETVCGNENEVCVGELHWEIGEFIASVFGREKNDCGSWHCHAHTQAMR